MYKKCFIFAVLTTIDVNIAHAHIRPLVSVSGGFDVIDTKMSQTITIQTPVQNTYTGNAKSTIATGGVSVGVNYGEWNTLSGQIGISYYRGSHFMMNGVVYQFADSEFDNLNYQYQIQNQRVFLESKLLTNAISDKIFPYFNVGIGSAFNRSSAYVESPRIVGAVPMTPGFANNTVTNFAYFIGAGLEAKLTPNVRFGANYRYVDIGDIQLGTSPAQNTIHVLKNANVNFNEVLLQLSYLF